ncbi:MAG: helix-turn-helix transcriptional regulator [Lachnospiraceae bacterium]|nr:helix-turn-helix transcriptional regulator [Lachnospiraceae bacterium]
MGRSDLAMTPLEKGLKLLLEQRPDIKTKIPTAEELTAYISWMAAEYGANSPSLESLPVYIGDETQSKLAERVLKNPTDKQALEQLATGYGKQSERRYILQSHDISLGRMLRYMPGQWHTSDYFEIYYAPCGECPIHFENEVVTLARGAVLITAPNVLHASPCYADDAILHYFMVRASTFEQVFWSQLPEGSLLASFFRKSLSGEGGASWLFFDTEEDNELLELTDRMHREFREAGSYSPQLLNTLMTEFFILTLKRYESSARLSRTEEFYWKHEYSAILSYIQQHFTEAGIEDVAQEFHYSTRQISRVVKSCFDLSYAQLVLKLKMEKASALLTQGDISVTEVGELVGYADTSSFCRAFSRYYGTTPRAHVERPVF